MSIKTVLKQIDSNLNRLQPKTMCELIDIVHKTKGIENYGTSFSIVKYKGYLQGIRVYVTGRKISHVLPAINKVYATMQGIEKYEQAGWKVEFDND